MATQTDAREKLTPRQREVLATIERRGQDDVRGIAAELGITTNGVHGHIRRLRDDGVLPKRGRNGRKASAQASTRAAKPADPPAPSTSNHGGGQTPPPPDAAELSAATVAIELGAATQEFIAKLEERQASVRDEIGRRKAAIQDHEQEIAGLTGQAEGIDARLAALHGAQ